jgi:hypothetical protein
MLHCWVLTQLQNSPNAPGRLNLRLDAGHTWQEVLMKMTAVLTSVPVCRPPCLFTASSWAILQVSRAGWTGAQHMEPRGYFQSCQLTWSLLWATNRKVKPSSIQVFYFIVILHRCQIYSGEFFYFSACDRADPCNGFSRDLYSRGTGFEYWSGYRCPNRGFPSVSSGE